MAPGCKEDVQKGLVFVLGLINDRRNQILKINFGHASGLSGLSGKKVAETEEVLRNHMAVLNIPTAASIAGDVSYVPVESGIVGIMSEENETMGNNSSVLEM